MTRWYKEKKKEHFYKQAKKEGYRARSAYKLLQIQRKFNVIQPGDIVVDLGAFPGGWSQVAHSLVQPDGLIVGVDISRISPYKDVIFIKGDITDDETIQLIYKVIDFQSASVVLSDMAPNISGNYSVDHARSMHLSGQAFKTAEYVLCSGGSFVCKVFMGEFLQDFVDRVKGSFEKVKQFSPVASRKSSSEQYIIASSYKQ